MTTQPDRLHHPAPRLRATFIVALFLVYAGSLLFLHLFHEEDEILSSDECPACQLLHSTTAAQTGEVPELPVPADQKLEWIAESPLSESVLGVAPASRSPPPA